MPDLLWLIGTKHFPESNTLSRNENTSRSPKYIPDSKKYVPGSKTLPRMKIQNTSQDPKLFWILGCVLDFGKCFWILGSVIIGFWEVFWILGCGLDSEKCFWILGSVLTLRATIDISHFPREYVLVKQPTLPSLWFQRFQCLQCRGSSPR